MTYVYVASPYTHADIKVRDKRYNELRKFVANHTKLYRAPVLFSPILHCRDMAKSEGIKSDAATWNYYNLTMLRGATELWVLKIPGWSQSIGINGDPERGLIGELEYAHQLGKPVKLIDMPKSYEKK